MIVSTERRPASLDHAAVIAGSTAHSSGHGEAPPGVHAAYVARVVRAHPKVTSVTTTECRRHDALAEFREALGKSWGVGRQGEYLCCWQRSEHGSLRRSSLLQFTDTPHLEEVRDVFAGAWWLKGLVVTAAHLPSSVEMGDHWRDHPALVETWQTGAKAWARWIDRRQMPVHVGADTNINMLRPAWRAVMRDVGLPLPGTIPTRGSHGSREIDLVHLVNHTTQGD